MIQRIQTVWLLVAGLLAAGTFELPFYKGTNGAVTTPITAGNSSFLICVAAGLLALIGFATIFLFKNRSLQSRLCILGIVVSIGLLILENEALSKYASGSWGAGIALPILTIIALILAMRGIRKDQKLVKSLDRLR